jgi:hypothetical protein
MYSLVFFGMFNGISCTRESRGRGRGRGRWRERDRVRERGCL